MLKFERERLDDDVTLMFDCCSIEAQQLHCSRRRCSLERLFSSYSSRYVPYLELSIPISTSRASTREVDGSWPVCLAVVRRTVAAEAARLTCFSLGDVVIGILESFFTCSKETRGRPAYCNHLNAVL